MEDICGYYLDKQATIKRFFDVCNFYGLKNKDLAKLFNVSDVIVSYWRTGKRFPKWDTLMLFAYTVGLPLEVMIIGKPGIQDPQLVKAINRIDSLKEKKYISNLQELLDNGELDSPPLIGEGIFNPLEDRIDFLDYTSTQYAKLCADVQYYGLKKRSPKQDKSSKDFFETSIYECSYENPVRKPAVQSLDENLQELIEKNQNPLNTTIETASSYIGMNGTNRFLYDEDGNLLNGPRLDGEAYDKDRTKIILRFRNGLLDGDEYDENGKYLGTQPAVEAQEGHLEYWRKGFLHRDGGLAAVVSKGFTYKEYWENGKRIK